jgi:hypothetical protein
MRRAFPRKLCRRRALVETLFSSVKRKLSARAPGHSLRMQTRQALLLGLSFSLYRLRHRYFSLRMSTEPPYLNPTDKALVLCVDEKSQIQAGERRTHFAKSRSL